MRVSDCDSLTANEAGQNQPQSIFCLGFPPLMKAAGTEDPDKSPTLCLAMRGPARIWPLRLGSSGGEQPPPTPMGHPFGAPKLPRVVVWYPLGQIPGGSLETLLRVRASVFSLLGPALLVQEGHLGGQASAACEYHGSGNALISSGIQTRRFSWSSRCKLMTTLTGPPACPAGRRRP